MRRSPRAGVGEDGRRRWPGRCLLQQDLVRVQVHLAVVRAHLQSVAHRVVCVKVVLKQGGRAQGWKG